MNIVNNQWAISTFQGTAGGEQRSFAARGPGYGIAGIRVDGNDFLAVYAVTQWAAQRARTGGGPTLIELVTYRAAAHSTSDDPSRYRPEGRLRALAARRSGRAAEESPDRARRVEREAAQGAARRARRAGGRRVEGSRDASARSTKARASTAHLMFEDVYKEFPENLRRQSEQLAEEIKLNAELGLAAKPE